eukprot:CAMPEP_0177757518 /NCGR_PEP_ID=MMETSP0491_2-20121128/3685_1 /TAXON_ID=63592 /ORGANISM="Tetraselmis chuii, Strain PLY429" /LENGTH=39 /DNA_ID= /DNA_START= /DNA_END= /DNA_ORIENTATION=
MPATPSGGTPGTESTVDDATIKQAHAAQTATELHNLAVL